VTPADTIENVKAKIQEKEHIKTYLQKLVIQNQVKFDMQDDDKRTLSNYGIWKDTVDQFVIHCHVRRVRPRGSVNLDKEIYESFGGPGSWEKDNVKLGSVVADGSDEEGIFEAAPATPVFDPSG